MSQFLAFNGNFFVIYLKTTYKNISIFFYLECIESKNFMSKRNQEEAIASSLACQKLD